MLWACASALAQSFPSKPLRILVPSVPGSSPDIRARQIAGKLAESLGQPVLVENRPGGNGVIAAREAAKAPADGYTLFLALINNAIGDALAPDPCCRLNRELVPVSRFTMTPLVMVVHPSVWADSLRELIELAKAKPNALTYASGGPGSITQLVGEWVKAQADIEVLEIPYKSVGAELPDLTGGQVNIAFLVPNSVAAPIKAGKLRALAVTARERLAILPEVPTTAEAGLPRCRGHCVERHFRSRRNAATCGRDAQPRARAGFQRARDQGSACEDWLGSRRRHTRAVRRVRSRREREVGEGDQGRRNQA